jgi:two-component system phosphate regulon sensor histidine kinase PhoR
MTNRYEAMEASIPNILIIDDEERIRDACCSVLTEDGCEVDLAVDGKHGLALIKETHFDIVLLDLMMPTMSGFDVLSQIKDLHPDTVVIVITGYATLEHSIEAMKKGAFDFIPKPFSSEQLRVVVSKAIEYTRALEDIANTRSRIRVMVNRLSDGVMCADKHKQVALANPAFLRMIGSCETEVVGRRTESFIKEPLVLEMIDTALAMPKDEFIELTEELCRQRRDGSEEMVLNVRCAPFRDRRGLTLGTITVLHDITTQKQVEKMKSDFVSMVSHEIRSPMNSVLMQIKVILDGLAGDVTIKQAEILGRASQKIQNLVAMSSELLDLAKIESGLIVLEKEPVDMVAIIEEQFDFHQARAVAKGLDLVLAPLPHLPRIFANRQNMEEVLSNLITNAILYTPPGGRISVNAWVENDSLHIRVSDTGIGIPAEDLDRIFSRFYRVKNEKTRHINGTGLGLPIVKSIVEAHQGSIEVDNRPDGGSAFTVDLPLVGV